MPPQDESNTTAEGPKTQGTSNTQGKKKSTKKQGGGQKKPDSKKGQAKPKAEKKPREKKERPQRETPAHLAKIDKVAAQLPPLSEDANAVFTAANNLSTADMCAVLAHTNIAIRKRGIIAAGQNSAKGIKLAEGMRVRIVSGTPKFRGKTGTLTKVQRIRCYVKVDGKEYVEKEDGRTGDYFMTSDVEPLVATTSNIGETLRRLTQPAQGVDVNAAMDEENADEGATGTGG